MSDLKLSDKDREAVWIMVVGGLLCGLSAAAYWLWTVIV